LTYIAALLTGNQYYLDELQNQADFGLLNNDPVYLQNPLGIFAGEAAAGDGEVRGTAWDLRQIADAAYLTPASDPMKAYFTQILNNNIDWLTSTYITNHPLAGAGQVEGWIPGSNGAVEAPWQEDFLAMSLGKIVEQGFSSALPVAQWMVNFEAGRF